MTDILVGSKVKAADFPVSVWEQDTTEISDATSTAFITGSPTVDVTFVAPTSGKVLMFVGGAARANTGDNRLFMAANVFLGTNASGTEVLASSVQLTACGWSLASTSYYYQNRSFHLTGLTPGSTYYARSMYSVTTSGATDGRCDISCREIGVIPIP
ncbi:hypothetical protein Aph01nite_59160 [Acrocarpospora phusangensis]|uniref:Uncharacterized protein n=1 Tax=Acrocarpospora phusangensis TaxID=1070424 RepID=A0A919QGS3_9ACTN|nr:hypothetical protein [Acrocarpospora phusangensis]GIH27606.1 hypothetical protein Aph01nite_59160 [Acrocarpospora phusangensis]